MFFGIQAGANTSSRMLVGLDFRSRIAREDLWRAARTKNIHSPCSSRISLFAFASNDAHIQLFYLMVTHAIFPPPLSRQLLVFFHPFETNHGESHTDTHRRRSHCSECTEYSLLVFEMLLIWALTALGRAAADQAKANQDREEIRRRKKHFKAQSAKRRKIDRPELEEGEIEESTLR